MGGQAEGRRQLAPSGLEKRIDQEDSTQEGADVDHPEANEAVLSAFDKIRLADTARQAALYLFLTWRASLLLLPSSPIYGFAMTGVAQATYVVVVMLVPYLLMCVFCDKLSTVRASMALLTASIAMLAAAAALNYVDTPIHAMIKLALLSFGLWGMDAGLQMHTAAVSSYSNVARRCLFTSVVFVVLAAMSDGAATTISIVLPFASYLLILVYLTSQSNLRVSFCLRADSMKRTNLMTENPFWLIGGPMLVGVGAGCVIGACVDSGVAIIMVAITLLASGAAHACAARAGMGKVNGAVILSIEAIAIIPLLFIIPFVNGFSLAVAGAALVFLGRTQNIVNSRDDFEQVTAEVSVVDLFFYGWRTATELFGTVGGAVLTASVMQATYTVDVRMVYFGGVLEIAIALIVVYLAALVLWKSKGRNIWLRKVELVARRYGLTPRQRDVLKLLSHGRNAEFISRELVVSKTTVKTHTYAIYKKTRVHNQQELIDLIESMRPEG